MGWAFALSAGMVTAFNPCGVALLPAFLSFLLSQGGQGANAWWRGAGAGVAMTAGFVVIFGLAGLTVSILGHALFVLAPIASTVVALALLGLAWQFWHGSSISLAAVQAGTARWIQSARPGAFAVYGISYGLVSLTCSLPVFLAVAATGFQQSIIIGVTRYVLYGVGMGIIVTGLAILTVTARHVVDAAIHAVAPVIPKVSATIMVLGSLYLLWYWFGGPGRHTGLI